MNNTRKYNKRKNEYDKHRHIVTIFSSASNEAPRKFKSLCYSLGKSLSENNYKISYGASVNGCGTWMVDGAIQSHKGNMRAVGYKNWKINKRMYNPPEGLKTEIIKTHGKELGERIIELKKNSMAIVALAGGPATMEELWNSVTGIAELNAIPVIILDPYGFYDGTMKQIEKMAKYFYWPKYERYVLHAKSVEELIQILEGIRYIANIEKYRSPVKSKTRKVKKSSR